MSPQAWARRCAARPWRTVFTWIALVVISAGISAAFLAGGLTTASNFTGSPDSKRADDLRADRLNQKVPIRDVVIVQAQQGADTAGLKAVVADIHTRLTQLGPAVVLVAPLSQTTASQDGRSVLLPSRYRAISPTQMPRLRR